MKKKTMLLLLAGLACGCVPRPGLQPRAGAGFRSLSIKFQFQDEATRQNGRVLWRFDENCAKFLFFSPLNQVEMELAVCAENAVLVNHGKKTFWSGDFSRLLDRIWGISLTHADLKSLLAGDGSEPAGFAAKGIEVSMKRAAAGGALESVRLRRGAVDLSMRILKDEFRAGKIVPVDYAERYRPLSLEDMLADD